MPFHEAKESVKNEIAQQQKFGSEKETSCKRRVRKLNSGLRMRNSSKISKLSPSKMTTSIQILLLGLKSETTKTALLLFILLLQIISLSTPTNAHSLLQNRHTPMLENSNNNNNNNNNDIAKEIPSANAHNSAYGNTNNNLDNTISGSIGANSEQRQPNAISLNGGYQNRCSAGWMWFNNKCWVATQSRRDFSHAVELCRKLYNNSTLPTIHTEEENEFLRQKLDLKNSPIWLYARHNHQYNKTRWLDRTGVNFTHWDAGQPSDKASLVCIRTEDNWYMKKTEVKDGQTECVSFWEDGKWGTQVGCQVLLPVVCEKKLTAMAKYQIQQQQPNGSVEPSSEYSAINGASNGAGNSLRDILHNQLMLFSIIATSFISHKLINLN